MVACELEHVEHVEHVKEVNKRLGIWSARSNDDYCALGFREDGQMTWFWIGSHAAYDAMLSRLR